MTKYVEIIFQQSNALVIEEITMDSDKLIALLDNDEFGSYLMDKFGYSVIFDWTVFEEPFLKRVSRLLSDSKLTEQQVANFTAVVKELEEYLFDFPYQRRMRFIIRMYESMSKAYNEGGYSVIAKILNALDEPKELK